MVHLFPVDKKKKKKKKIAPAEAGTIFIFSYRVAGIVAGRNDIQRMDSWRSFCRGGEAGGLHPPPRLLVLFDYDTHRVGVGIGAVPVGVLVLELGARHVANIVAGVIVSVLFASE